MSASSDRDEFLYGTFPDGFIWSTATASYQIEGGWNQDGKGVTIWDTFCQQKGKVLNGDTGDVACDSYHRYKEDISLIKELGTKQYRFSISWSRILPDGTIGSRNQKGIDYYNRLIDGLLSAGVEPMVTLYHWDLPQTLQDQGGWTNPVLVKHFTDYAKVCFQEFGDRVKNWITFNEPWVFTWLGHVVGQHAPGYQGQFAEVFTAAHHVIKSHVSAYRMYQREFTARQEGQIGISLSMDWIEPKDPSNPDHVACSDRVLHCRMGWWAGPIYGSGDYPEVMKEILSSKAAEMGLTESPLPKFTKEEIRMNKGSADFFGLNNYTTRIVSPVSSHVSGDFDAGVMGVNLETDPTWKRAESEWLYVVPWGLRRLLRWIDRTYGHPAIYITENGFSDTGGLDDTDRISCVRAYINETLKAIRLDACDVRAYTLWSLLDNFEWACGYSEKFGIHHVDFNDPERKRTPKKSAKFYANIIKNNGFPEQ